MSAEKLGKRCIKDLWPRLIRRLYRDFVIIFSDFLYYTDIKLYSWIDSVLTTGVCLGNGRRKESNLNLQKFVDGEVITALGKRF